MNILFLTKANKQSALDLVRFLQEKGHNVDLFYDKPDKVDFFDEYDLGISYFYPHILRKDHFEAPAHGVINCHISYLPDGRGAHPNVWSIISNFPAGVTIHWIDEGVDTGRIISNRRVKKELTDTGHSLYQRLEQEMVRLFTDIWDEFENKLLNGGVMGTPQIRHTSHTHRVKDLEWIRDISHSCRDHMEYETVLKVIDVIRACTFPGHKGAYFIDENGERVYMELKLYRD